LNPFLSTRHLTDRREDHLTEFFAGALDIDERFRQAYADFVIGPHARRHKWEPPVIRHIATQGVYEDHASRPDMILTLQQGQVIAVEHKLEAYETLVSIEKQVDDPIRQLARYLSVPTIDGVAYVRTAFKPPETTVLEHPKYMRPNDRQHFLWRDFFPLLEESRNPYTGWLLEGFEALGFTPPNPTVGDLTLPENRHNFAKLWNSTRACAHDLGWKVGTGDVVEIYLEPTRSTLARQVWVSPNGERLLLRITPLAEEAVAEVLERVREVSSSSNAPFFVEGRSLRRGASKASVIEAWAPLRKLLGEATTTDMIEERLRLFVEPVLRALDRSV